MKRVIEKIKENNKFLILSHRKPDGDSIGSQIALALALKNMNKKVYIYNQDEPPKRYARFEHTEMINTELNDFNPEIIFALDSAEPERIGHIWENIDKDKPIINVDHHVSNIGFGDINIVKPDYSSTAEIIYEILTEISEIDEEIATYLYIGILTDTGSFRYPNTTSHSLRVASRLVNYGVLASQVSEFIWFTDPPERIKLLGDVLQSIQLYDKFSIMFVTRDMLKNRGADEEDTEEFVDYGLSIKGIKACAFIKERDKNKLKVSLRAKNGINVQDLASEYGGGGHKTASGFIVRGNIEELKEELAEKLKKLLN